MPENLSIELRCNKNNGGSYTGHTFLNGKKQDAAEYSVHRGDCDAVALLYSKIKKLHPGNEVHIKGLDKLCMDKILRMPEVKQATKSKE